MKRRDLPKGVLLSLAVAAVLTLPGAAQAETIELTAGDFQSTQHVLSKDGIVYWMNLVEEKTGGTVHFTHFPSEQAAKAKGLLDAVKSDALDIAFVGPTYNADRLPLYSVVGLPGTYLSSEHGSPALNTMTASGLLHDEFLGEGVLPIFSVVLPPYQVLLKGEPATTPADFVGLKLRTGGTTQGLTARSLGATSISLAGPEVYTALERGTVDGVLFPLSSVPGYNLQEVVNAISTNGSFGGYGMTLIINKEAYDALPDDVKAAMLEAGSETAIHLAEAQDASIKSLLGEWKAQGITLFEYSDEEQAAFEEAMSSVAADWIARVSEQNAHAPEVIKQYQELLGAGN